MGIIPKHLPSDTEIQEKEHDDSAYKSAVKGCARAFVYLKASERFYIIECLEKHRRAISKYHRRRSAEQGKALYSSFYPLLIGKIAEKEKEE